MTSSEIHGVPVIPFCSPLHFDSFALLLPHSHKMAAMASDIMMSSLHGPLKEENGAKEKEGVRAGERKTPPEPH